MSQPADTPTSLITQVVSRAANLTDADITLLTRVARRRDPAADKARQRALGVDSPRVVDALVTFDTLEMLWRGAGPDEALSAVKRTCFDAVAAVFAEPVLSRREFRALIGPFRDVTGLG